MKRSIWFALVLFLFATSSWGLEDAYCPLTPAELGTPFPLTYDGVFVDGKPPVLRIPAGLSIATVSKDAKGNLVVTGKGREGKDWSILLGDLSDSEDDTLPIYFFHGDLDNNGLSDLVVTFPTNGNGMAPESHTLTFLFDAEGLPVPDEFDGYFASGDYGAQNNTDLFDMDHDGRAILVHMDFSDGYWVTSLYKAKEARWVRKEKTPSGKELPLYTRFTYAPNRKSVKPRKGHHPGTADYSNETPWLEGRLISYEWGTNSVNGKDIHIKIADAKCQIHACNASSWYFSLVIDSAGGRKVVKYYADDDSLKAAFEEVKSKAKQVQLYGKQGYSENNVAIIWAVLGR